MSEFEEESYRQWIPDEDVTGHDGEPLPDDRDFFAEPPAEIGEVITAWSTLKDGAEPWGLAMRLLLSGIVGLLTFLAFCVLFYLLLDRDLMPAVAIGIVAAPCAAGAALYTTRFVHNCTYVGQNGIARINCRGSRANQKTTLEFLFEDASELRTSQTVNYYNGVYTGTAYAFAWSMGGKKVQRLSGTYRALTGLPAAKDPYCFAHAAEVAWSQYFLDRAQSQLEKSGAITFRLSGTDRVRVGPGFIELFQGSTEERLESEDIDSVSLDQGIFTVKRVGGKKGFLGIGRTGVFSFNYNQMANARVFLLALDMLMGLRFA